LCGRQDRALLCWFFEWKQDKFDKGAGNWRHHEAAYIEDFLGIEVIESNNKVCGFCTSAIKRRCDILFRNYHIPSVGPHTWNKWWHIVFKLSQSEIHWQISILDKICSVFEKEIKASIKKAPVKTEAFCHN